LYGRHQNFPDVSFFRANRRKLRDLPEPADALGVCLERMEIFFMTNWTRPLGLALAITTLASASFAADSNAPLPAGKPAGVHQALLEGPGLLWVGALVVVGIGIGFAVSNDNGSKGITTNTTTSSTGTGA
jgi:hypothetical protein